MAKVSPFSPSKSSAADMPSAAPLIARDSTVGSTEEAIQEGERRCLVTHICYPKNKMIRFVLAPDQSVVPDLAQKLPGRGLWVRADRATLVQAVQKNLFSKAAKARAIIPSDLVDQVERLLAKRCLDLLGLARGSGAVITGQPQVEEAAKTHSLSYVLFAKNAGNDSRKKLAHAPSIMSDFTKDELASALGREHLAAIGMRPHALTTKLRQELDHWHAIKAPATEETELENPQASEVILNTNDCERT